MKIYEYMYIKYIYTPKLFTKIKTTKRTTALLIFFSYPGPSGILVLIESGIPLKSVLGCMRIVALSISSHEQSQ